MLITNMGGLLVSMGGATNFSKNVFWGPKNEFLNLGGPGLMGGPVMMGVPSTPMKPCILTKCADI